MRSNRGSEVEEPAVFYSTRNCLLETLPTLVVPTRISCLATPDTAARAAFIKESRMKFASATKINRKSGSG